MSERFDGTFEELAQRIEKCHIGGNWEQDGKKRTFRSTDGGVLNWWESTGTLQIQGRAEASQKLRAAIAGDSVPTPAAAAVISEQIFIVHGHDTEARDQLELALHRL